MEAYLRAYLFIRVCSKDSNPASESLKEELKQATANLTEQAMEEENYLVAEAKNIEQVKALLAKGYKYDMEYGGVKLFTKNKIHP